MHILLIGPRASGKTTLGRQLAKRLNRPFTDLDERVLAQFDQPSVRAVWNAYGEAAWRSAEVQVLAEVMEEGDAIIALGGGAPIIPEASAMIDQARRSGEAAVVYLAWEPDVLIDRLKQDTGDRPGLISDDPATEVPIVLAQREPIYRSLADVIWDGTRKANVASAVREVLAELQRINAVG